VPDQKRRSAGVVTPRAKVRSDPDAKAALDLKGVFAELRDSAAAAAGQGGQPVSIKGLARLSGYLIRQAQLWVFHDFNQRLAPLDLRPAQYSILSVTRENPGLSQMALSQVLGIGRSALVPLLDVLEARRLLKRAASDRRSHALHLTAEGTALLERADLLVMEQEKRLIEMVGPRGHQQLLSILEVFARRE
jgi:DNA-binding MarR family transcriptional regulator